MLLGSVRSGQAKENEMEKAIMMALVVKPLMRIQISVGLGSTSMMAMFRVTFGSNRSIRSKGGLRRIRREVGRRLIHIIKVITQTGIRRAPSQRQPKLFSDKVVRRRTNPKKYLGFKEETWQSQINALSLDPGQHKQLGQMSGKAAIKPLQGAADEPNSGQDGTTQKDDNGSQPTPQKTAHPSAHDGASQADFVPGQSST